MIAPTQTLAPTGAGGRRPTAPAAVPVLVVDDNSGKRLALTAMLAPLHYQIVEADSGIAALRRVMDQDFAVILLDVRMPLMDGVETAALIRQRQQSEMTPIIFVTAHAGDEIVHADRYVQGAVDFIVAPVAPDELRAKVSVFASLFCRARELTTQADEVQRYADQLRLLADAAPIGFFQTDARNRYLYTNPRWSEITGIAPEDAAGRRWDIIVGSDPSPGLLTDSAGATDESEIGLRFAIRRPDATARIVHVTSKRVADSDGSIAGWVGTLADVTAEAGAETAMSEARDEATKASRLKSDFLANMSHEIRTPMNGVLGMADLLLETDLDPRQRDYAQAVRNSGDALLTIINDILDFSKVESGKVDIEHIEFSIRTIVDGVADLLAGPAQAKGLELITVVDSHLPGSVTGDPGRVRQVLTNLIGNALKFTHTGEIVVRVTAPETENDGVPTSDTVVRFEVSDTGDGIATDKLELIFAPFVQADTSTSRKYGGTGLGLTISSQLVALMGGDCGVSSELGAGSTFWFTIRVQPGGSGTAAYDDPALRAGLAGVSALIVSNNATQRGILSDYLTEWGMTVGTAASGPSALATLRTAATDRRPFAVALLDWSMPGTDGPELRNAIGIDPALTPRLVLLTDLGHRNDVTDPAAGGACTSVTKPVHLPDLLSSLRVALGLPALEGDAPPVAADPAPQGQAGQGRLLLAEDNLINQKVAVAMLSSAGYRVDTVGNGAAAVQAVVACPYDAVLMDCQMPELNGYEATAAIRALKSAGRLTPIIAMTAGARLEDRERCLAEGMDRYLSKPVSKDALLSMVARSVKNGADRSVATRHPGDGPGDELIVDPHVLDELRLLAETTAPDFLATLVDQFIADTEPLLVELRLAVDIDDAPAVARIAHSIKGSGDQLGGRRLALSCSRLEAMASADSLSDGQMNLREVEFDCRDLCRTLLRQLSPADRLKIGDPRV